MTAPIPFVDKKTAKSTPVTPLSADSFADYARLLGRERYAAARGTGDDTHRFASALQHAGYATDPSYANKITAIAEGATMRRALAGLEKG